MCIATEVRLDFQMHEPQYMYSRLPHYLSSYTLRITDNQLHLHDMFFGSVTMQYATRNCATIEIA